MKKQNKKTEPQFDKTFSCELLYIYLSNLIRRAYIDNQPIYEYCKGVDINKAFDVFITHCYRLKEPLFLLALIENRYDELIELIRKYKKEGNVSKDKIDELLFEWTDLYNKVKGQKINDEILEKFFPYRYARLSQAAKSWKYKQEYNKWLKDNNIKLDSGTFHHYSFHPQIPERYKNFKKRENKE